jgi:hypothetical protein
MTDKMTLHPLNMLALATFSRKVAIVGLLTTSVLAQPAIAVDKQWWFDVEVILFERNLDTANIPEKFKQSRLEQPTNNILDLLTPYIKPDISYLRAGLPYCRASNRLVVKAQYEQDFAFPLPVAEIDQSHSALTDQQLQQQTEDQNKQTAQSQDASSPNLQHNILGNLDPSTNIELDTGYNSIRPPIQVEFIEWQVPSEILCAYAEQIDPSFASIVWSRNEASLEQSNDQIKRVPQIINGIEWQQNRGEFLLPISNMYMSELYQKIQRQRDITPILHVSWRQEVKFGRENADTFRLFAGENFAEQFDSNGLLIINSTNSLLDNLNQAADEFYVPEQALAGLTPEQRQTLLTGINNTSTEADSQDIFTKIAAVLADDTPFNIAQDNAQTKQQTVKTAAKTLKEIWKLDGGISVYLRNVGRIPYLHIDSNLDFRQPIFEPIKTQKVESLSINMSEQGVIPVAPIQPPNFLRSVNFNQLRRVISKQVHYFDHPLFGMIVRINRYRWPEIEIEIEQEQEQETDINNSGP